MCQFISWCSLTSSEQAAWVQAIGSVLAILIAIAIPAVAGLRAAARLRQQANERMLNAALKVFDPISTLRTSLEEFYEANAQDYDPENFQVKIDPHDGDFYPLIPPVIGLVSVIDDLGTLAPAMRKFVYALIEMDRFHKMIPAVQRSGIPSFWLNNREDIRAQIKDVMDKADVVITGIKKLMEPPLQHYMGRK